jgi:protocatechuate 3,4-dioxygenase, alpha subunit
MLKQTGSQTVGPFFSIGLPRSGENILVQERTSGQRIYIIGQVLDGDDQPLDDALVEVWQADAQGIYNHPADPRHGQADPHFRGFGRCSTDDEGNFSFKTIKPGSVAWDDQQQQAPHLSVRVFARGMLLHALTRLYFSDESSNQADPVLNSIADPERRQTLIALGHDLDGTPAYRFDIHLQGERETTFFEP